MLLLPQWFVHVFQLLVVHGKLLLLLHIQDLQLRVHVVVQADPLGNTQPLSFLHLISPMS
ncbi:hypothetical protein D9M71_786370 [compost metagenome]